MAIFHWKKEHIGEMNRCYSVRAAQIGGVQQLLVASEAEGGGMAAYRAAAPHDGTWVSETLGGTMSIVPVPDAPDTFYVGGRFFPHFTAQQSDVVCCKKTPSGWTQTVVLRQPYLHRFDVFSVGAKRIFVGCTLCGAKQSPQDWSSAGAVYVGYLQDDPAAPITLTVLQTGLYKNHGYWRGQWNGREAGFIAADNGVFVFTPAERLSDCRCTQIWAEPASEVALWDLDGDGVEEMAVISPMHGDEIRILHESSGGYREVYRCPRELEFCHALWAGSLCGVPAVLCGARRKDKPLLCITCRDGHYETEVIDTQVGSSNVCVYTENGCAHVLSANNGCNEIAIYTPSLR